MTTISGASAAGSAWSSVASARSTSMRDKMFAKVDTDGSGGVDKTELQSMLDHISEKTGVSLGKADDVFSGMDANGDGSLSKDELKAGMKSLMPKPSSTVDFAQQRADGAKGSSGPDGPPPCDGPPPGSAGTAAGGSASSTTSSTDPLDTNGDGVVSAEERLAGDLKSLMKLSDTNGDSQLSTAEASAFADKLASLFSQKTSETALSVTA